MPCKLSEGSTRKEMKVPPFVGGINPQLEQAGWYLRDYAKIKTEIPTSPDAPCGVDEYDAEPWNGVSDYTLYRENGEVLAVVEAKKTVVVARVEALRRRMEESTRQVHGLFESLLAESFGG